jgi:GNAT superfamily N-acetyltransferase
VPDDRPATATPGEPEPRGRTRTPRAIRTITRTDELAALRLDSLSEHFDPFLPHFLTESLRVGGEVTVAEDDGRVSGVLLYHEPERVASVFTRDRTLAEALARLHPGVGVFSDFPLGTAPLVYQLYGSDRTTTELAARFTHRVRSARDADRPALAALLREVNGAVDERWLEPIERAEERCFVVEVADDVVGAAWVSVVPGHARLHSLAVRPGFRRMGIGSDLARARRLWAAYAGADRLLTEIAEENVASRAIATAGGMRVVGQIFLSSSA